MPEIEFFYGDRYRATWITDSVRAGYLLESRDYLIKRKEQIDESTKKKMKSFVLNPKTPYTLTECIKIDELNANTGATYWQKMEKEGHVPNRTCDSMRNLIKVTMKPNVESYYLSQQKVIRFSHDLKCIPAAVTKIGQMTNDERVFVERAPPKMIGYHERPRQQVKAAQAFNKMNTSA